MSSAIWRRRTPAAAFQLTYSAQDGSILISVARKQYVLQLGSQQERQTTPSGSARGSSSGLLLKRWRPSGKVILLVALVALGLATQGQIFTAVIRGVYLAAELVQLRQTHQQLASDNKTLSDTASYLETAEGRKLAARSELDALEPGERVIIIHEEPGPPPRPPSLPHRVQVWLAQRRQGGSHSVHQAIAIIKYWLGVGQTGVADTPDSQTESESPAQS